MKLKDLKISLVSRMDRLVDVFGDEAEVHGGKVVALLADLRPPTQQTTELVNVATKKSDAPKPCRSPYCECSEGKCTHPGMYDAREGARTGKSAILRSFAEAYGRNLHEATLPPVTQADVMGTAVPSVKEVKDVLVDSLKRPRAWAIAGYTRGLSAAFADNADRQHANHMLASLDPEHLTRIHDGAPPSPGWWPISLFGVPRAARWWDGERWSRPALPHWPTNDAAIAATKAALTGVQWRHRPLDWPVQSFT